MLHVIKQELQNQNLFDKARNNLQEMLNSITFEEVGKKCLSEIDGDFIKQKYPNINGKEFGQKLHEERVKWIKRIEQT